MELREEIDPPKAAEISLEKKRLSAKSYMAFVNAQGQQSAARIPHLHTILTRYGSWKAACEAAGLESAGTRSVHGKSAGFGTAQFSHEQVLDAFTAFVREADSRGLRATVAAYQTWALDNPGVPRIGAVRKRLLRSARWLGGTRHEKIASDAKLLPLYAEQPPAAHQAARKRRLAPLEASMLSNFELQPMAAPPAPSASAGPVDSRRRIWELTHQIHDAFTGQWPHGWERPAFVFCTPHEDGHHGEADASDGHQRATPPPHWVRVVPAWVEHLQQRNSTGTRRHVR